VYGEQSRQAVLRASISSLMRVKVTLGPKGAMSSWTRSRMPTITKDGVTVAKEIELKDPLENMGAQMVREVATRRPTRRATAHDGDGPGSGDHREGAKNVVAGANPMDIKRASKGRRGHTGELKKMSKPVSAHGRAGRHHSANNDETDRQIIADAMDKVGKDGVITVEEAKSMETSLEVVEGSSSTAAISPYFVTDPERRKSCSRTVILTTRRSQLHEGPLAGARAVARLGRPLLIIAETSRRGAGDAVVNKLRGTLQAAAVKAPGFGDRRKAMLEDIAILTHGRAITEDLGSSSNRSS